MMRSTLMYLVMCCHMVRCIFLKTVKTDLRPSHQVVSVTFLPVKHWSITSADKEHLRNNEILQFAHIYLNFLIILFATSILLKSAVLLHRWAHIFFAVREPQILKFLGSFRYRKFANFLGCASPLIANHNILHLQVLRSPSPLIAIHNF